MTGNPHTSQLVDPKGRTIDYLRLSVTDLCNMRCFYCMPKEGVHKLDHHDILRLEESLEVVREAAVLGISKVRITGGEPLIRRGIVSLAEQIREIPQISTLGLTTNGIRLAQMAEDLCRAGVDRINVSLDSLNPTTFSQITRGGDLCEVLSGIDRAMEAGFPIKLNVVMLDGINTDQLFEFVTFARDRKVGLRFIERMGFNETKPLFTQQEALSRLGEGHQITPIQTDPQSPHVAQYLCDDVPMGFISPMSHSFCGSCNKLRLTPEGKLRVCLASEYAVDVKHALRRPHTSTDIQKIIRAAVNAKLPSAPWSAPPRMWKVGG